MSKERDVYNVDDPEFLQHQYESSLYDKDEDIEFKTDDLENELEYHNILDADVLEGLDRQELEESQEDPRDDEATIRVVSMVIGKPRKKTRTELVLSQKQRLIIKQLRQTQVVGLLNEMENTYEWGPATVIAQSEGFHLEDIPTGTAADIKEAEQSIEGLTHDYKNALKSRTTRPVGKWVVKKKKLKPD